MKRLSVLLLGALALFVNACEKHPASELPAEHATEFGKYEAGHGEGEAKKHHEADPAAGHEAAAPAAEAAPTAAAAGEAPKFFPEKK